MQGTPPIKQMKNRVHRRQRYPEKSRRRDPEHGRRRRNRQGRARLQPGGAGAGVSAGQGAGEGRAPALSRPDSARRRAGLIPRAVDEALRERGVEPVDTPDIRDVVVEEGQPLKFTATFETVPPIEPGITPRIRCITKSTTVVDAAVDDGAQQPARARGPVRAGGRRGIQRGDSVVMDLVRTAIPKQEEPLVVIAGEQAPPRPRPSRRPTSTTM